MKPDQNHAGQTPAQLERALKSENAIRNMVPEVRRKALAELALAKRKLEGAACSSTWAADCWLTGHAFPPKAETTPMVVCDCERCVRQGRRWPAYYDAAALAGVPCGEGLTAAEQRKPDSETKRADFLSYECHLESLDDWTAAQLPSSPSGLALRAVREGRIKLRRQRTRLGRPQRAHIS